MSAENPETIGLEREFFLVKDHTYGRDDLLQAAGNLRRIDKQPDIELTALRERLIQSPGGEVAQALPRRITCWATARLIEICLDQELRLGLEMRDIDNLRTENTPAFIGRLAIAMSIDERQFLDEALTNMSASHREVLLRRLSGEGSLRYPGDKGLSIKRDDKMRSYLNKAGYPYLTLARNATSFFPEQRNSIFQDFEEHLPVIDRECNLLAIRLRQNGGDFDRMALSLFDARVSALGAASILNYLNTFSTNGSMPDLHKPTVKAYEGSFGHLVDTYKLRKRKREVSAPRVIIENTSEVEDMILEAIEYARHAKPPTLNAEEEVRLMKIIERGWWAQFRLAIKAGDPAALALLKQHNYEPSLLDIDIADDLLQKGADQGDKAVIHFLRSNIALARWKGGRVNKACNGILNKSEVLIAGAKGVYRAIHRFDYTLNYRFSSFASQIVGVFVGRAALRRAGIPVNVGKRWFLMNLSRERLEAKLYKKPSLEDIAQEMNARPEELIALDERVRKAFNMPLRKDQAE